MNAQNLIDIAGVEPFLDTGAYLAYKKIPLGTKGVYVFYDFFTTEVLYVGKAKDLRKRLYNYTSLGYGSSFEKLKDIANDHFALSLMAFKSEENYLLEDSFIKTAKPPFNYRMEL